jgi:hypothetical protein
MSMRELKIYLDITGDIVKNNILFKPEMLTNVNKTTKGYSRFTDRYASALYFIENIQYTKALFKKYKLNDAAFAVKIFSDKAKSFRFFNRLVKLKKKDEKKGEKAAAEETAEEPAEAAAAAKEDSLNASGAEEWKSAMVNLQKKQIEPITYQQLTEARNEVKETLKKRGYVAADVQKALTYAENSYDSGTNATTNCPDDCLTQNINFLLELLFKKRQDIFLNGKKYSIVKSVSAIKTISKNSNAAIVKLVVLDSSKPQSAAAYYDCKGKKKQLKDQLSDMYSSVFDFFDIDSPPDTTKPISEVEKAQLLGEYAIKRREYTNMEKLKITSKKKGDIDSEDIDTKLEEIDEDLNRMEELLVKKKYLPRSTMYSNRTRRNRDNPYFDGDVGRGYSDWGRGYSGWGRRWRGGKKITRKNTRKRRMSRKKRGCKKRRVTNKNI